MKLNYCLFFFSLLFVFSCDSSDESAMSNREEITSIIEKQKAILSAKVKLFRDSSIIASKDSTMVFQVSSQPPMRSEVFLKEIKICADSIYEDIGAFPKVRSRAIIREVIETNTEIIVTIQSDHLTGGADCHVFDTRKIYVQDIDSIHIMEIAYEEAVQCKPMGHLPFVRTTCLTFVFEKENDLSQNKTFVVKQNGEFITQYPSKE